ncbi:opioid growth factor receptor [Synchiropus splendidus]|uniref:opioid growth factor receptor n=1 Tax=Synchiropus splendidus TaxID=270530 RepID=UPI00237DD4AB|nr:opioid growth factor receptor [Synchiropus splendidus]
MEDDCACEYDSTWDTESDGEEPAGDGQSHRSSQDKNKSSWTLVTWHHTPRNMRAAKDMQNYRRGYPNLTEDDCPEDKMNNLQFYLNKFPSAPDDVFIESFLKEWKNDYKRLERVHSYIQWLFPLREPGVNYMATELTKKEIEAFKNSEDAKRRLVESYELMLGFYGIRLLNKETGEVRRAENWKERFGNLERNMHNNLRITRILKSLGELGFEHYQAPLVRFFLEETLIKKTLSSVKRSVLDYFLFAVLDKHKRQELVRFAYQHFEPKDKFVWCPRKIQKQFRKAEKRSEAAGNGEGREDSQVRAKSKDGDAAAEKTPKGAEKTSKGKAKPSESSVDSKSEASEGLVDKVESSNGTDSVDDMDQSTSPEKESKLHPKFATDSIQEPDIIMQTDDGTEKPSKKKREDDAALTNGAAKDSEGKPAAGTTSPSAQTPVKNSKHSPSLSSGREEKIPRTDFSEVPERERALDTCGSQMSTDNNTDLDEKKSDDIDMESNPDNSD